MRRVWWGVALVLALATGGGWLVLQRSGTALPGDLAGTLVFVSDRTGTDCLYVRRPPGGRERRLTYLSEPTREPALSPDGREVAFSMGGRIGVVSVATEEVRMLTLGVEWRDSSPAWLPDGKALVVVSRRKGAETGHLHLLFPAERSGAEAARRVLTETAFDEAAPTVSPDGSSVVFVREEHIFRLDLADGRTRRLTGGFRKARLARFLPSGRFVFLWSEDKRHGIDVMDASGRNRETLSQGSVFYRTLAPSPDGRFLAATFTFDLRFDLREALKLRHTEEVRLLDTGGHPVATLARSWLRSNHSPDWGP